MGGGKDAQRGTYPETQKPVLTWAFDEETFLDCLGEVLLHFRQKPDLLAVEVWLVVSTPCALVGELANMSVVKSSLFTCGVSFCPPLPPSQANPGEVEPLWA